MVQLPTVAASEVRCARIDTPLGDYELLDFGGGRRLERWGPWLVERPDVHATGAPRDANWSADWVFLRELGAGGHWEPTRSGLPSRWEASLGGERVHCRLGSDGRVGVEARDLLIGRWLRERIEGCYDLDEIRVLNLFAGNGYVSSQALAAGATVVHVDADAAMIELARSHCGDEQVEFVRENVMDYVEDLLRRQQRFDMIVLPVPPLGHGPRGQLWDREVDLPRLVRHLPRLVSDDCLGIWLSTDGGAITWKAESLGQLLREVLPGHTIEPLQLEVASVDGRVLPAGVAARWFDDTEFLQTGGQPLTAAQLEERLDAHMISIGAAEGPARALADHPRETQDFVLRCAAMVARTSSGMAFNFVAHVCGALRLMDEAGVEAWLLHCMDVYDTRGLHPAVAAFKEVEGFARSYRARQTGVAFEDVAGVLEAFVHGLNGRRLKLEAGEHPYTDSETIFLPPTLSRFEGRDANFQLYKAMVVHQWAQTWFGTWRLDVAAAVDRYADSERALACFHGLETLRLDACIERQLPGIHRQMRPLRAATDAGMDQRWRLAAAQLGRPGATVDDSLGLLDSVLDAPLPEPAAYQGVLRPQEVARVRKARIDADRQRFRMVLMKLKQELRPDEDAGAPESEQQEADGGLPFRLKKVEAQDSVDGFAFEIELDGRPVPAPGNVRSVMASILQDLGDIPEEYLHAAGDGAYFAGDTGERSAEDVWKGTYHEEGAFLYNEWDYERQNYRKNWAVVREMDVHPSYDHFVDRTLHKYRGLAMELRRTFEALRGEDRLLKKQPYGDDVDIDALVEALADARHGEEMSERLFTKLHKLERDIAVMFMVDMSGSTKGWINDAEREALALLCESLETLGDRYAIYGFSGMTRKRCEIYRVKRFDEPYDETVRARISGIRPRDYTRMGATIRHLGGLLNEVEARTRLLVTLSDGKPDDYDAYRGAYGIEDTRMALIEAKRSGIHPFCITIDTEARDYLSHMYGAVNYAVIDEVRKLPLKVSDIYRRLTS
ncbi:MAG TPA: methyltransferase domain-containing protein [Gammaproteobacteria bacterium]|nr:methyltransferase domain-containing protein [Gammaproteobacteria bacterium]